MAAILKILSRDIKRNTIQTKVNLNKTKQNLNKFS